MTKVFLSYSRTDVARVEPLVTALEAYGLTVWWDRALEQNANFGALIDEKIDEAAAVIVCWSDSATKSQWVRGEAERARLQSKYLGVVLGQTMLPTPFNAMHNANLTAWTDAAHDAAFITLLKAVGRLANDTGLVARADAQSEVSRRSELAERQKQEALRAEAHLQQQREAQARQGEEDARRKTVQAFEDDQRALWKKLPVAAARQRTLAEVVRWNSAVATAQGANFPRPKYGGGIGRGWMIAIVVFGGFLTMIFQTATGAAAFGLGLGLILFWWPVLALVFHALALIVWGARKGAAESQVQQAQANLNRARALDDKARDAADEAWKPFARKVDEFRSSLER